jgi:hypothetical protein
VKIVYGLAIALALSGAAAARLGAAPHPLQDGAVVRVQSTQWDPGWHQGTVQITEEGCALIWKPDPKVSGGRSGLGLMFIQKLERRSGSTWVDMPVEPMMKQEPKICQEGNGPR